MSPMENALVGNVTVCGLGLLFVTLIDTCFVGDEDSAVAVKAGSMELCFCRLVSAC